MNLKLRLAGAALAAATAALTFVPVAGAATAGSTVATFSIAAGGLAITVPSSTVALTGATASTGAPTVGGALGDVTVTDTRGALLATWTTTFSSTAFTTGAGSANETVTTANISYASGAASVTSGIGAFVPNVGTAMSGLAAARTVGWSAGTGNNSATWNPTLTFTLLPSQVAGTYTGTVTHSVA